MMIDVDGLSRRFGGIIATHLMVASMLHKVDSTNRPLAYDQDMSAVSYPTKLQPIADTTSQSIPILTTKSINKFSTADMDNTASIERHPTDSTVPTICSHPIVLYTSPTLLNSAIPPPSDGGVCAYSMTVANDSISRWIFLDDVCGSFRSWETYGASGSVVWDFKHIFMSLFSKQLFAILYPLTPCYTLTNDLTASLLKYIGDVSVYGFDAMFIPFVSGSVTVWLASMVTLINALAIRCEKFYLGTIWINKEFYPSCIIPCCQAILENILPEWSYTSNLYNTTKFGDKVAAHRIKIRIYKVLDTDYDINKPYEP